jgi:hypothetical protein
MKKQMELMSDRLHPTTSKNTRAHSLDSIKYLTVRNIKSEMTLLNNADNAKKRGNKINDLRIGCEYSRYETAGVVKHKRRGNA